MADFKQLYWHLEPIVFAILLYWFARVMQAELRWGSVGRQGKASNQFSLRSLFVATLLVAVILGLLQMLKATVI